MTRGDIANPSTADELGVLLHACGRQALGPPDGEAFVRWFVEVAPLLAPGVFESVPDPVPRRSMLHTMGRLVWNRLPLPEHQYRPRPLPKPERNAPCPCGSQRKYKHCCADAERLDDPFANLSLLQYVLEHYSKKALRALPLERLDVAELAFIGGEWCRHGRPGYAEALLEPIFHDVGRLDARAESAFDALADCYDELRRPGKKARLIERIAAARNPTLRSAALHRKITILADRGERAESWRLFAEAQRHEPDNPSLATLEITMLLGEGELGRARERGSYWIARLSRQRDHDYGELIATLRTLIENPDATALTWEEERRPGVTELRNLIAAMPPPEVHYTLERSDDEACLVADAAMRKLAAAWSKNGRGVAGAMPGALPEPEGPVRAMQFIAASPLAWHCFEVLDVLAGVLQSIPMMGADRLLLSPILEHGHTLLRMTLAAQKAERCALPWGFLENRPALRLLGAYFALLRRLQRDDDASALGEWMVGTLNPNDNQGMREELMRVHLERGDAQAALAVADRYPGDRLVSTMLDRALALYLLSRHSEAETALREAAESAPASVSMLLAANPKRPRLDAGFVTLGGKDEAWYYREAAHAQWTASGALDWARSVAPRHGGRTAGIAGSASRPGSQAARSGAGKRLQLRITLRDIEPPVWRRFAVDDDLTLAQLHRVVQEGFGWQDCHLHEFHFGKARFGCPDYDDDFPSEGPPLGDERKTALASALGTHGRFEYWYDFGDDWWHDIVVEATLDADPGAPVAVLVAGERACPPEDCGGPHGYVELVAALRDPAHPEHAELRTWAGDFDPERFDLARSARSVARAVSAKRK